MKPATVRGSSGMGLAEPTEEALTLTPSGTFFADAIAGTFAAARAEAVRALGAGLHTSDLATGRMFALSMG